MPKSTVGTSHHPQFAGKSTSANLFVLDTNPFLLISDLMRTDSSDSEFTDFNQWKAKTFLAV
jgi:hypothetical protein